MRKIVLVLGILLVIAMVLPAAAVQPSSVKTTGGGFVTCPDGQKCTTAWTAQWIISKEVNWVKGQAQAQHRSGADTLHADIDNLAYYFGDPVTKVIISGIVTQAPDAPGWLNQRICFVVVDGGKGGDDYVTAWYFGDWRTCANLDQSAFQLIKGGNAIVSVTP